MNYPSAAAFRSAGYSNIESNASYVGGLVRQHGNVSFSRVFEAGHSVAYHQPETVYQIFRRAIFGRDIATGNITITAGSNYSSTGPANVRGIKKTAPESPDSICLLYQATNTCTLEQQLALANGTAVVKDYVVVWPPSKKASGSKNFWTTGDTPNGALKERLSCGIYIVLFLALGHAILM
jgi:hypothetical protein